METLMDFYVDPQAQLKGERNVTKFLELNGKYRIAFILSQIRNFCYL